MKKIGVSGLVTLFCLVTMTSFANCIVPVSQTRSVSFSAYIEDYYNYVSQSDGGSDSAPDFELFDSNQSGSVDIGSGFAQGGGWQESTIGNSRIVAKGSQFSNAESYDYNTYGDAGGSSHFEVTFDMTVTVDARLNGRWSAYDEGEAMVILIGPGGTIVAEHGGYYNSEDEFDETVSLIPGSYQLMAYAYGSSYADGYQYSYSFADYEVALTVCPIEASITCVPGSGTLPFESNFTVDIGNFDTTRPISRLAARIDVDIANGNSITNWRAGYTQLHPGVSWSKLWYQQFPQLGSVLGDNVFTLLVEDVTPAPYNQPPYGPSGFTVTDSCTVTGLQP